MPLSFNHRHISVEEGVSSQAFTPHGRNIRSQRPNVGNRATHGNRLAQQFSDAARAAIDSMNRDEITAIGSAPGILLEIQSPTGFLLHLDSIGRSGVEILNVRTSATDEIDDTQLATVFIPEQEISTFLGKLRAYVEEDTQRGFPRYRDLVEQIDQIRTATVRALWTDPRAEFPSESASTWWEVWLRHVDGAELTALQLYCERHDLPISRQQLVLSDRSIALVYCTVAQMTDLTEAVREVSEFRRPHLDYVSVPDMPNLDQVGLVESLQARTEIVSEPLVWVTVMDTGVNAGHPLLANFIDDSDLYTYDAAWGTDDHDGHGTEMAGLVLYGDLKQVLNHENQVVNVSRLESVKVLPPPGFPDNLPEIWGLVSARAVAFPESQQPERRRVFFGAVAAVETVDRGIPTSWSAAIDALAAGRSIDFREDGIGFLGGTSPARLIVVSGGNASVDVSQPPLDVSDLSPVLDPAQAWNAITIGGFTNQAHELEDGNRHYAEPGDLSPHSSTSVTFDRQWPLKPDVVFEAGNIAVNETGDEQPSDHLDLVTLNRDLPSGMFTYSRGTSAAGAEASRLLATLLMEYPDYRAETARGLLVHSADWTPRMREHFTGAGTKSQRARLVRRYGFGVPNPMKLLKSADDYATLVIESTIRPYRGGAMNEINFHELPWPSAVLEELAESRVRMRVTLSYFVEPNPGRRGWSGRYSYASHQLRFDLKRPGESISDFHKRLNKAALGEHEERPTPISSSDRWFLGPDARNRGSLHSDIWEGPADELAACGHICVFPIGGWWKDQPRKDRSRDGVNYSLLVTLDTSDHEIDVYSLMSGL